MPRPNIPLISTAMPQTVDVTGAVSLVRQQPAANSGRNENCIPQRPGQDGPEAAKVVGSVVPGHHIRRRRCRTSNFNYHPLSPELEPPTCSETSACPGLAHGRISFASPTPRGIEMLIRRIDMPSLELERGPVR